MTTTHRNPYQAIREALICAAHSIDDMALDPSAKDIAANLKTASRAIVDAKTLALGMVAVADAESCLDKLDQFGRQWRVVADATAAAKIALAPAESIPGGPTTLAIRLALASVHAHFDEIGP